MEPKIDPFSDNINTQTGGPSYPTTNKNTPKKANTNVHVSPVRPSDPNHREKSLDFLFDKSKISLTMANTPVKKNSIWESSSSKEKLFQFAQFKTISNAKSQKLLHPHQPEKSLGKRTHHKIPSLNYVKYGEPAPFLGNDIQAFKTPIQQNGKYQSFIPIHSAKAKSINSIGLTKTCSVPQLLKAHKFPAFGEKISPRKLEIPIDKFEVNYEKLSSFETGEENSQCNPFATYIQSNSKLKFIKCKKEEIAEENQNSNNQAIIIQEESGHKRNASLNISKNSKYQFPIAVNKVNAFEQNHIKKNIQNIAELPTKRSKDNTINSNTMSEYYSNGSSNINSENNSVSFKSMSNQIQFQLRQIMSEIEAYRSEYSAPSIFRMNKVFEALFLIAKQKTIFQEYLYTIISELRKALYIDCREIVRFLKSKHIKSSELKQLKEVQVQEVPYFEALSIVSEAFKNFANKSKKTQTELESQINALRILIENRTQILKILEENIQNVENTNTISLSTFFPNITKENDELKNENELLKYTNNDLSKENELLQNNFQKEHQKNQYLKEEVEGLKKKIEYLTNKLVENEKDKESIKETISIKDDQIKKNKKKIQKKNDKIDELEVRICSLLDENLKPPPTSNNLLIPSEKTPKQKFNRGVRKSVVFVRRSSTLRTEPKVRRNTFFQQKKPQKVTAAMSLTPQKEPSAFSNAQRPSSGGNSMPQTLGVQPSQFGGKRASKSISNSNENSVPIPIIKEIGLQE